MQAKSEPFDLGQLSRRVEQERQDRGLTMAALSSELGVSQSTIRRCRTADDAEADGVLALIGWLGDPPEHFIDHSTVVGTPLPPAGAGQIRVDMDRVRDLSSGQPGTTRTTIQRLAAVAQTSGRTIASLTRWSEF